MKKQKRENIDLLTAFQLYLYNKGLIVNHDWDFEKQAKKFLKSCIREADKIDKKVEIQFEFDDPFAFESFTKLKEQLDEVQKNMSEVKKPDGGIKHPLDIDNPLPYVTFEKSEQEVMDEFKAVIDTVIPAEDVIRSYVEESNLNKGEYVLVIQCRNGRKFIVAGDHYAPTYLQPYDQSSDTLKASDEKK